MTIYQQRARRGPPRPNDQEPVDLINEKVILEHIMPLWQVHDAHKLRFIYQLDYALLRFGDVRAYVEMKCRPTLRYGTGRGLHLSLSKVIQGLKLTEVTGRPSFFIGWLADGGIYWRPIDRPVSEYRVEIYGRKDAMNLNAEGEYEPNEEPCVVFPWDTFKFVADAGRAPTPWKKK